MTKNTAGFWRMTENDRNTTAAKVHTGLACP